MEKDEQLNIYARELRRNATKEENTLWYQYLRNYPVRFRRQRPLGPYIADFYCAKARLVIELDGSQHFDPDGMNYDAVRTEYMESLGLKVLRFSNTDINQRLRDVCDQIDIEIAQRYRNTPLSPGEGRRAFSTLQKRG